MPGGRAVIAAATSITIDGASGELLEGAVPTIEPALSDDFATLMGWADRARRLRIRANAETTEPMPRRRSASARRGSACAAPSTCSSTTSASSRCAR